MGTRGKLLLATVAAAVTLGALVGVASARRFEVSERAIRAIWTAFVLEDLSLLRTTCPVTIEGSFHSRTFSKISGGLIGYITRAVTNKRCAVAEAESLWLSPQDGGTPNSIPWHLRYESFSGALPQVRTMRIQVINLGVKFFGTTCSYLSNAARPAYLIPTLNTTAEINRGRIESIRWDETVTIPRIAGVCAENARLAGTGTVTVLGGNSTVRVELVT